MTPEQRELDEAWADLKREVWGAFLASWVGRRIVALVEWLAKRSPSVSSEEEKK